MPTKQFQLIAQLSTEQLAFIKINEKQNPLRQKLARAVPKLLKRMQEDNLNADELKNINTKFLTHLLYLYETLPSPHTDVENLAEIMFELITLVAKKRLNRVAGESVLSETVIDCVVFYMLNEKDLDLTSNSIEKDIAMQKVKAEIEQLNKEKSFLMMDVNPLIIKLEKKISLEKELQEYDYLYPLLQHELRKSHPHLTYGDLDEYAQTRGQLHGKHIFNHVDFLFTKLRIVNKLKQDLTNASVTSLSPLHFEADFIRYGHLLGKREDTIALCFLKVLGTALSLGLLSPFLWRKPKCQQLCDQLSHTLFSYKKSLEVDLHKRDVFIPRPK